MQRRKGQIMSWMSSGHSSAVTGAIGQCQRELERHVPLREPVPLGFLQGMKKGSGKHNMPAAYSLNDTAILYYYVILNTYNIREMYPLFSLLFYLILLGPIDGNGSSSSLILLPVSFLQ